MIKARDWLSPDNLEPHFGLRIHPDDYDPTDDQLESLIAAVQVDAQAGAEGILEQLAAYLESECARWETLVQSAGPDTRIGSRAYTAYNALSAVLAAWAASPSPWPL